MRSDNIVFPMDHRVLEKAILLETQNENLF